MTKPDTTATDARQYQARGAIIAMAKAQVSKPAAMAEACINWVNNSVWSSLLSGAGNPTANL